MNKNEFAYYNKSGRLIRVKEDTLTHFSDITPHIEHPLNELSLKASYIKWRDAEKDSGEWVLIGTYDFFIDGDEVCKITREFKGIADYKKPRKVQSHITDEMIRDMKRRFEAGEKRYSIASLYNIHHSTVSKYVIEA